MPDTHNIDAIHTWTSGRMTFMKLDLSATPLTQLLAVFDFYYATRVFSIHIQVCIAYIDVEPVFGPHAGRQDCTQ